MILSVHFYRFASFHIFTHGMQIVGNTARIKINASCSGCSVVTENKEWNPGTSRITDNNAAPARKAAME